MALPEVNRARIEKLNIDVTGVKHDIESILGDIENIDPIILDENFPNIIPPAPSNVIASALFRNIQVSWAYNNASYIAEYEAHASQSRNFHTNNDTVVWRGMSGGFNHKASVGETWYFKVRIKNRHGEYSAFSEEVSATTVDISDFEINEQYKIDLIEYTNQYTDERKDEIMGVVAGKLDAQVYHDNIILKADADTVQEQFDDVLRDLNSKVDSTLVEGIQAELADKVDAEWVNGQLVSKADESWVTTELSGKVDTSIYEALEGAVDTIEGNVTTISGVVSDLGDAHDGLLLRVAENESSLVEQGGKLTTVETEVDEVKGTLSATVTELSSLGNTVSGNTTAISANSTAIGLKADQTVVDTITGDVESLTGELEVQAGLISAKAEQSSLDTLEGGVSVVSNDLAELTVSVGGISSSVSTLQQTTSDQGTEISGINSSISQMSDSISAKVEQSTYDALEGSVGTLSTKQAQLIIDVGGISTDVSSISETVGNHGTSITGINSSISQMAGSISAKVGQTDFNKLSGDVSTLDTSLSDLTVDVSGISATVSNHSTTIGQHTQKISDAETSISAIEGSITSLVSKTEYTEDIDGIIDELSSQESRIEQTETSISSKVEKTDFNSLSGNVSTLSNNVSTLTTDLDGITAEVESLETITSGNTSSIKSAVSRLSVVEGEIGSFVKETTYNQDKAGIISDIESAESLISQNATAIQARVTTATHNALTGRVSTAEGKITANATAISQRVTQSTYDKDINDGKNGLFARMESAEAGIDTVAGSLRLYAKESELDTRMGDVVHRFEANEADIAINSTAISNRVTHTEYNALTKRVSTAEGSVTTLAGQVALKASTSDLNGVKGRLSTAESTLKVLPTSIESKVSKDGVISAIRQTPESVKIQAAKVEIDGDLVVQNGLVRLKDAIIDKVHIKDSAIIGRMLADSVITNRMIASNASIDFAKIGNVQITNAMVDSLNANKITAGVLNIARIPNLTADKITIGPSTSFSSGYNPADKVDGSYVQTAIGGIEVGGRNLILNSGNFTNTNGWGGATVSEEDGFSVLRSTGTMSNPNPLMPLEPGQEYIVTMEVKFNFDFNATASTPNHLYVKYADTSGSSSATDGGFTLIGGNRTLKANTWNRVSVYFKTRSDDTKIPLLKYHVYPSTVAGTRWLKNIKLEKGNKATDWTPAPEDVDSQISSVDTKASTAVSTASSADSKASSAVSTASSASSTASTALDTANSASSTASTANTNATQAKSSASSAVSTANSANTKATNAQTRVGTVEGRINNAVTTIDGAGVTVADGSFFLKDSQTNEKYSIVPKDNLVRDHSFELVHHGTTTSVPNQWINIASPPVNRERAWYWAGAPKVAVSLAGEINPRPIFGNQAVAVRSMDYVFSAPIDVSKSTTYTLSCHFKRQNGMASGIPRLEVYRVDALGNAGAMIASKTFTAVKNDHSVARHALTFTTPSTLGQSDGVEVRIKSSNTNWVHADGVQLVQGSSPVIYDPETGFFGLTSGSYNYQANSITTDDINVRNSILLDSNVGTIEAGNNYVRIDAHKDYASLASEVGYVYLQTPQEVRVTTFKSGTNYRPIRASRYNVNGGMFMAVTSVGNNDSFSLIGNGSGVGPLGGGTGAVRLGTTNFNGTGTDSGMFYLGQDGTGPQVWSPQIYKRTYASAANMHITSFGTIGRATSAAKYKLDINKVNTSELEDSLLSLDVKSWKDKGSVEDWSEYLTKKADNPELLEPDVGLLRSHYGLIAEDLVDAGLDMFVHYGELNEDGTREVEGIEYDRLWVLLIPIVKALKSDNENLKRQVDALYGRMEVLENKESV